MSTEGESPVDPILSAALAYAERGWSPIPVPYQSKAPVLPRWQRLRLTAATLPEYFSSTPLNLGVLLGSPSNWLIDVDLDHDRCVELADQFLPATHATFGRPGNPRSHWLYQVTSPLATKKFLSRSAGMLVEVRSTGLQTIFPPSTHESGELIAWEEENPQPLMIAPDELLDAVRQLADAVKVELGEKTAPKSRSRSPRKKPAAKASEKECHNTTSTSPTDTLIEGYRNDALASLAGKLRYWGAEYVEIEAKLLEANARRCHPPLDEEEVRKIAWSIARYQVGATCLLPNETEDDSGLVPLGQRDPETCRLVLSPKRTLPTAEAYVRLKHDHREWPTLTSFAGSFWEWKANRLQELEDDGLRCRLHPWLHRAMRYVCNKQSGELELADFEANPATVNAALETLRAAVFLPAATPQPSWLVNQADRPLPLEIVACRSKLLHLPTKTFLPPTPAFFTMNSLEFDPDFSAPQPVAWFQFLHQLFDGDIESLQLLQEWFGYCLIADTSQQKMLLIVGPKRSGKGTIARVLARLVGLGNVCGPTTSALAGPFGLQPLIGKSLAIVSDARFHGENISTVVERLLCISGEDTLTIDRKHLVSLSMKLPTRFVFLTNEFPRLTDASGALAGRFLILRLTQSFYGQEDHGLTDRLLGELPGILNWAIEGWQRLKERCRFVMPTSVADAVQEVEDLSSPVTAFVREECLVGPGQRITVDSLYDAWRLWCECEGRQLVSTKQSFGRDLAAAVPGIGRRRSSGMTPFYEGIGLRRA